MKEMMDTLSLFIENNSKMIHIVAGFVIFLLFFIFRNKLSKGILNLIARILFKKDEEKRRSFTASLMKPLAMFFLVLGIFIGVYLNIHTTVILKIFKISVILIIGWAAVNYLSDHLYLLFHFDKDADSKINTTAVKFISNILKILIIAFAIVMVISELGYNINGLLTGLGVGGLAVSLAAQDAVSNLISGFIIVLEKPFVDGEFIQTSAIQGTVEEVTMRSTKIRTREDSLVTIPNSTLTNDAIVNISRMEKRLIDIEIGLVYATSNELLKQCQTDIEAYIRARDDIVPAPVRINFTKLDNSSLNLSVYCYTTKTDVNDYLETVSEINYAIKDLVESNGAEFAFPSSSVYIEKK